MEEGKVVRKPRSNKNYINGPDFHKSLVVYLDKCWKINDPDSKPKIPEYIGQCIMQIAQNLGKKYNFINYSFREEMELDAIEKMVEKIEKYDVNYRQNGSPNPFGYFSQIAWNQFIQRIGKEKKETYTKHKNFDRMDIHPSENMQDFMSNPEQFHEEHLRVIGDFEDKDKKKSNNYATHKNLDYSKNRKKKLTEEKS